ncbi:hypothetical protein R1flu_026186 [Riccia fluitans]|uniref:Uncharacterized protein n=1 Tax=Riccia fluitans TaxID=41844 RepID=A0ABD1XF89_9MARC
MGRGGNSNLLRRREMVGAGKSPERQTEIFIFDYGEKEIRGRTSARWCRRKGGGGEFVLGTRGSPNDASPHFSPCIL